MTTTTRNRKYMLASTIKESDSESDYLSMAEIFFFCQLLPITQTPFHKWTEIVQISRSKKEEEEKKKILIIHFFPLKEMIKLQW